VGSQFWDLDFTQGVSHDPRPGIFLAHDFQDMDGELGDFIVSEGHRHPLVKVILGKCFITSINEAFYEVINI